MCSTMRVGSNLSRTFNKYLEHYSKFNPSPLSIKQFLDFGAKKNESTSFEFLRKELPVRLANIMQEIQLLPENLLRMPSVAMVSSWYEQSFTEILHYSDTDPTDETTLNNFCQELVKITDRHSNVVPTMAQGVIELKETHPVDPQTEHSIQYFLSRFYMNRISIRMLIHQHTILFGSQPAGHKRHVGVIDPHCNISDVIHDAYENARFLCEQYYCASPELRVEEVSKPLVPGGLTIVYAPSHLYHIVFELFKNAMRAVVEYNTHGVIPPIDVLVVKGAEDLSIRMTDRGGGIPRSLSELLFHYMYSTAPRPPSSGGDGSAPLAGYGYGLPLSRLYARYFHGDLLINSYQGYGTDAIVYLKVLTNEANELLPVFNKASSKHYRATIGHHDWSSGMTSSGIHGPLHHTEQSFGSVHHSK